MMVSCEPIYIFKKYRHIGGQQRQRNHSELGSRNVVSNPRLWQGHKLDKLSQRDLDFGDSVNLESLACRGFLLIDKGQIQGLFS